MVITRNLCSILVQIIVRVRFDISSLRFRNLGQLPCVSGLVRVYNIPLGQETPIQLSEGIYLKPYRDSVI